MEETKKGEIIIYKDQEGPEIQVRLENETVWLTLEQISKLFDKDKSVISRHLSSIFKEGELSRKATIAKNATVQIEGNRTIIRQLDILQSGRCNIYRL